MPATLYIKRDLIRYLLGIIFLILLLYNVQVSADDVAIANVEDKQEAEAITFSFH